MESLADQGELDFFNRPILFEMDRQIQRDIDQDKASWDWAKESHKIYPSSLNWGDCPIEVIRRHRSWSGIDSVKGEHYARAGDAEHRRLQQTLRHSPMFQKFQLRYPSDQYRQDYEAKMAAQAPEQCVRDYDTGISGRIDLPPALIRGKVTIVDIKSKNTLTPDEWAKLKGIPKNFRTTLCVYAHTCNKLELYERPIEQIGIIWINRLMDPSNPMAGKEVYEAYTKEMDARTALMLRHIAIHRQAAIDGREEQCTYEECRVHG